MTGTAGYRERIALPPTALVRVQLVDVSRADAAAVVLGEQVIEAGGRQPPFAFEIRYDPAKIDQRMSSLCRPASRTAGNCAYQRPALRGDHARRANQRGPAAQGSRNRAITERGTKWELADNCLP